MEKRGLYIHIPFCIKKCKYCDFVSYANGDDYFSSYINNLIDECAKYKGMKIDTVFIGGGTPTALPKSLIARLLESVFKIFSVSGDCEITIEANPKTLDDDKLRVMRQSGINRLSIGVQSFNDDELLMLGRIHNGEDAIKTIELAKKYFDNLSIDLMMGLPNQKPEDLKKSILTAEKLDLAHISCYSLILEDGTPMKKMVDEKKLTMISEDADRIMYHMAVDMLEEMGFCQYEVSNFAKAGFQSRHNLKYWNTEEYVGVGVAAHSYLMGERFSNTNHLSSYLNGTREVERAKLSENDKITEYIMMRLRLNEGISFNEFKKRFSVDFFDKYKHIINKMENGGFVIVQDDFLRMTSKGRDVQNSIICEFI